LFLYTSKFYIPGENVTGYDVPLYDDDDEVDENTIELEQFI